MRSLDFTHRASDGEPVYVHRWLPDRDCQAVLLVAHGMAEHGARYARLAGTATQTGWAVYAPDLRGHGLSAGEGRLGWFAEQQGFRRVVDDLHEVSRAAAAEYPDRPIALLGHSMGSVVAETYAALYGAELCCCALSGVVAPADPITARVGLLLAGLGCLLKGSRSKAPLLDTLSFGAFNKGLMPVRTPFDWLSRDAAEVDTYIADPYCGFICTDGLFRDLLGAIALLYRPQGLIERIPAELPLLIMAGAEDPVGGARGFAGKLEDRLREAGLHRIASKLYPGARHEILNETNREEVTRDLLAWLEAHGPKAA